MNVLISNINIRKIKTKHPPSAQIKFVASHSPITPKQ